MRYYRYNHATRSWDPPRLTWAGLPLQERIASDISTMRQSEEDRHSKRSRFPDDYLTSLEDSILAKLNLLENQDGF